MQILVAMMLSLGFVASFPESLSTYNTAKGVESLQIAIDNVATKLGQLDSRVFTELEWENAALRSIEVAHHPVHVCAESPFSLFCGGEADPPLHVEIRMQRTIMNARALASWRSNPVRAKLIALDLGVNPNDIVITDRAATPELESQTCFTCQLEVLYEAQRTPRVFHVYLEQRPEIQVWGRIIGKSITGNERWTYQLSKRAIHE